MVFTTLSSTGRRVFERMKNAFDTVLIDEAAQASEVAVLQPLSFGCKRCACLPVSAFVGLGLGCGSCSGRGRGLG